MLKNPNLQLFFTCLYGALLLVTSEGRVVSATPLQKSHSAISIQQAAEVIDLWTAEQHLYVKGDLGISDQQLASLEKWLDENAPHWTIVLMHTSRGESYRALDGRTFRDQEAVEYALGHGLANRTDFGRLTSSQTGETDGAIFVLFLQERKFSYYGSDIHDRRGIGESAWRGDLDAEAIRAMRNGGRIIDAVTATIKTVHSRLDAKLAAEDAAEQAAEKNKQNAIKRAAIERRRERNQLTMRLNEVRDVGLPRIESAAREIRAAFPDAADSELANPSLDGWKKDLENLKTDLAKINIDEKNPYQQSDAFRDLQLKTNRLRSDVDRLLDLYAAHKAFSEIIFSVETRLDLIADAPDATLIGEFDTAYLKLKAARDAHARGRTDFIEDIKTADQLVSEGENKMHIAAEEASAANARRALIRRTLAITAAALGLLLIGVLWLLNLRRRPALHRAHLLFERRSKSVAAELEGVDAVLRRSETVLGNPETFAQKGFEGRTEELGSQTLAAAGRIGEMAHEATGVIENANQLLHPSNPVAEMVNLFSGARYEHCGNFLNGESLRVPATYEQDAEVSQRLPLQETSPWLTFEQFFGVLRSESAEISQALDQFNDDLSNAAPKLESAYQQLAGAIELEQALNQQARADRLFSVSHFRDSLIPAVQSELRKTEKLVETDPVRALAEPLPSATRKLRDGLAIARSVGRLRAEVLPPLKMAANDLSAQRFDTRWIGTTLSGMSDEANSLLQQSATHDVATVARKFDSRVTALGTRAKRCVELALDITQTVAPSLGELENEIADARKRIADSLNLPAASALHEPHYNPDHELDQANKQLQSARAALDYGGVDSVLESLQVIEIEKSTAREMIQKSLAALDSFPEQQQHLIRRHETLEKKLSQKESSVSEAQLKFAPSSLRVRRHHEIDDTGQFVDMELTNGGEETVLDWLSNSKTMVETVANVRDQVSQLHFGGRVLEAANLLELVDHELATVDDRLEAIGEHCGQLHHHFSENVDRLKRLESTAQGLSAALQDSRTQSRTIELFGEWKSATTLLTEDFERSPEGRDPLLDAARLHGLEIRGQRINGNLIADRNAHGECERAVTAAKLELKTAQQSVFRSVHDRIPDSEMVSQCQSQIASLTESVEQLQQSLPAAHGDWKSIHRDALRVTRELGLIDGRLRNELRLAESTVQELEAASEAVYEASNWRGDYRIVVVMQPGIDLLERARRALAEGEYGQTIQLASSAAGKARAALSKAKSQVIRERIKREREAASRSRRNNRLSAASSFFGSSSDDSGSGISFGSSSSSSSNSWSSSSSFGSSDSGFSSSGW